MAADSTLGHPNGVSLILFYHTNTKSVLKRLLVKQYNYCEEKSATKKNALYDQNLSEKAKNLFFGRFIKCSPAAQKKILFFKRDIIIMIRES